MSAAVQEAERALDELVELVLETKQARWKMAPSDELRRALSSLAEDCGAWSAELAQLVSNRGASLTRDLRTVAGRRPGDLFPSDVDHASLVALFDAHLRTEVERLRAHAEACRPSDAELAALLDEVAAGLDAHRATIAALG